MVAARRQGGRTEVCPLFDFKLMGYFHYPDKVESTSLLVLLCQSYQLSLGHTDTLTTLNWTQQNPSYDTSSISGCTMGTSILPFFPKMYRTAALWLTCAPSSVQSQRLCKNLCHCTAFDYVRHQNAMKEHCPTTMIYYSPCPLIQHPSFCVQCSSSNNLCK